MRASLLARAMARTLWCNRFLAASSQGLSPSRPQLFGLISTTHAAWTNRTRRYRLPRFDILPRIVRSPVEICLGTSPSQAAKSRPLPNASPLPMAATIALEMIGPIPGTLISRWQPASRRAIASISLDKPSMRSSRRRQSPARSSMTRTMRGDRTSGARPGCVATRRGADLLRHGVLLGFAQLRLLAGQEHGRTIPLPDIDAIGRQGTNPSCAVLIALLADPTQTFELTACMVSSNVLTGGHQTGRKI